MCYLCDGGTVDELLDQVAANIERVGWHVSGVSEGPRLGWAFTIGLSERFDHPELAMTGACCFACAGAWLHELGERVAAGERFVPGSEVVVPSGAAVRFGPVHERQWQSDRFNLWKEYYARAGAAPVRAALQVILRDRDGTWQDDHANRRWRHHRLDRSPLDTRHR